MNEMLQFAVDWWKKALVGESGTAGDISIDAFHGALKQMAVKRTDTEKIEKFGEVLMAGLVEEFPKLTDSIYSTITLGCDYHPERLLHKAQEESGISELLFPHKTYMYISKKGIQLAEGYGSRAVWVYPVR